MEDKNISKIWGCWFFLVALRILVISSVGIWAVIKVVNHFT